MKIEFKIQIFNQSSSFYAKGIELGELFMEEENDTISQLVFIANLQF